MDYDLTRLGEKEFEHLSQALLVRHLGPDVEIYGAGPDGGREAAWEGHLDALDSDLDLTPERWGGYNVAQAKYCNNTGVPKENARWITKQIKHEFDQWTNPETKRERKPNSYLIITNVRLSAVSGGGADKVHNDLLAYARDRGLILDNLAIWHYDKIRTLLDNSADIRAGYAAWTTPGDVLARLLQSESSISAEFHAVLETHAAKLILEDTRLNLTQAGSVGDGTLDIADVYIELPARSEHEDYETKPIKVDPRGARLGITSELIATADHKLDAAAIKSDKNLTRACRIVLIGGPGQGKSTVTQYLTQLYRAAFIKGTAVADTPEVGAACKAVTDHATSIGLTSPVARRWPVRIVLTELADSLSKGAVNSVLHYICAELSRRSAAEVAVASLRAWLRSYPWLVIFDGLDEVPESSNRAEVLNAISDFYIDARGFGADVVIVTTTRPQGYNNDFNKVECRHYELTPLPRDTALSYANQLISKRLGEKTDRSRRVWTRLEKASADKNTSILMSTPLQTTILTILVERLGHAPKDRWRLFSSYYRVIYQREQEKGGPLAELLQDYESDINAIHFEIGFILQQRGQSSGDATSSISKPEFTEIIAQRMRTNGNSPEEASRLADEIVRLATDRLVFLAVLRSNAIGFEIRSLQEYMAAERIATGPESTISHNVRAIAESDYWRNVLLFVAGSIFANKNHLCAEIVALCNDLNTASAAHRSALLGSHLAHALLSERISVTKPVYSRLLATTVTDLLKLPPETQCQRVANLLSLGHEIELESALRQAVVGSRTQRLSAALTLSMLEDYYDTTWATKLLKDLTGSASEEFARDLLSLGFTFDAGPLIKHLSPTLESMDFRRLSRILPSALMPRSNGRARVLDVMPPRIAAILEKHTLDESQRQDGKAGTMKGMPGLELAWNNATHHSRGLDALASYGGDDETWKNIAKIASCAIEYTSDSLSRALAVAQNTDTGALRTLMRILPWPFNVCFDDLLRLPGWSVRADAYVGAEQNLQSRDQYYADRCQELIDAAKRGEMGNTEEWNSIIESSPRHVDLRSFLPLEYRLGSITGDALPTGASYPPEAVLLLSNVSFSIAYNSEAGEGVEAWVALAAGVHSRMPACVLKDRIFELVRFIVSVSMRHKERRSISFSDNPTESTPGSVIHSFISNIGRTGDYESTSWLSLVQDDATKIFSEILDRIIAAETVVTDSDNEVARIIDSLPNGNIPWRIARILLGEPHLQFPADFFQRIDFGDGSESKKLDQFKHLAVAVEALRRYPAIDAETWVHDYVLTAIDRNEYHWNSWYERALTIDNYNMAFLLTWLMSLTHHNLQFVAEVTLELTNSQPTHVGPLVEEIFRELAAGTADELIFE
ncbi:NACHT domain-containing protein [Nocardia abscessus]|uniref:NACHT domain-containing protein n=1 Tax=Nocardia abscessus TaxID=120957 RepID=UPI0024552B45|nr:hypothetical protein [Nocardia abscessus]